MQTGGAHSTGVERIPSVTTVAHPSVVLAGRPSAKRTANAGASGIVGFRVDLKPDVRIQNDGRFGGLVGSVHKKPDYIGMQSHVSSHAKMPICVSILTFL